MGQFPVDIGISEVRGIIEVVKDNGNSLSISKLSEEAEEEIDKLLPLIDACEMLGLCTVENGIVKNMKNSSQIISKALSGIEPFRSIKEALAGKALTTSALANMLKSKNIVLFADDTVNIEMLRNLLIKWGVRTKMLSYDRNEDKWSLTR